MTKIKNVLRKIARGVKGNLMFVNLVFIALIVGATYLFVETATQETRAKVNTIQQEYNTEVSKNQKLQEENDKLKKQVQSKDSTIKTLNENYDTLNKQMEAILKALKN